MKKNHIYLIGAIGIAAMGLWSCSNDDEPSSNRNTPANAIRFAANTEHNSRAGDFTTNNLRSFNVYAYTGTGTNPVLFMDNVTVRKNSNNSWTYSPIQYWPANDKVDFYAFAPSTWIGSSGPLKAIPYDASEANEDLIYATSPDMSGNTGSPNAQVVFNFRHAMSKVTVKMSSTNTGLRVQVSNVAIANIMTRGNFHFPSGSTAEPVADHTVGTWTDQNTPIPYLLHISQTADDVITLTTTPTDMSATGLGIGGAKYVIPQDLVWMSNGTDKDTYITVMCSVYDRASGEKLWPNANTPKDNIVEGSTFGDGLLKFPLSTSQFTSWRPGYYYTYNLVINSNDEMGAIEFGNPTVEGFVEVNTNYD
ncbi:MAG: fimbrillin family protein [Duncaniella sp.]|nr:fimbrillin family protein [Duncaniella sp.]